MKRDDIQGKINDIEEEIRMGRWTASAILELKAIAAQLETALALSRIADAMEIKNAKGN